MRRLTFRCILGWHRGLGVLQDHQYDHTDPEFNYAAMGSGNEIRVTHIANEIVEKDDLPP